MIQDVSNQMFERFTAAMRAELEASSRRGLRGARGGWDAAAGADRPAPTRPPGAADRGRVLREPDRRPRPAARRAPAGCLDRAGAPVPDPVLVDDSLTGQLDERRAEPMIPPSFDYHAPNDARRGGGAARAASATRPRSSPAARACCRCSSCASRSPATWSTSAASPASTYIKEEGGFLKIGALVRESALEALGRSSGRSTRSWPTPRRSSPIPLVRNLATVAGNLAHGDPANDHPATMLALGAEVVATGPERSARRSRSTTSSPACSPPPWSPTEILTEIRIPVPPAGSGGAYVKLERKVGDFATAGAAARSLVIEGGAIATRRHRPHQRRTGADEGHGRRGLPGRQGAGRGRASPRRAGCAAAATQPERRPARRGRLQEGDGAGAHRRAPCARPSSAREGE